MTNFITFMQRRTGAKHNDRMFRLYAIMLSIGLLYPLRYINIKPDDVARLLQGRPLSHDNAPAGLRVIRAEGVRVLPGSPEQQARDLPENVVPLRRRQAAHP